ncbi:MAG TPA: sugar ABC transporter substrate-binding protein [Aggregatilineales bacterium]|nr:sugar ABC transporter substrate-binding protein [Aggregatilineales bacterium]
MHRKLGLMLVLALLLVLVIPAGAQDTTTIRYFTFSAAPDHLEELDTIIQAFQAENPGIVVEVSTAPFADYFTLLQADVVSGDAPDVFELNFENFVTYAANDTLMDISEYLSGDAPYYPRALEAFQYEGAQLALPETFSTVLLFYNADLFDAAGLEYPAADWTWADAVVAAEAIKALGDDTWGIFSPVQFWEFYKKAGQNGECEFFNEDMTESTLNSAACVATLETMISFIDSGLMPTQAQMSGMSDSELFLSGKLGMIVTGIWMFDAFKDAPFAWDVQLEPGLNQKGHHFFANGVGVSATTANAEAAAKWAEFLTASATAAEVRVASAWELPALDAPELFEAYLQLTPPENREAVFAALESPVTPPVIERQNEMQDAVNLQITRAVDGEVSAQEALDEAKAALDALIR